MEVAPAHRLEPRRKLLRDASRSGRATATATEVAQANQRRILLRLMPGPEYRHNADGID